jgi:hypothetical protein
MKPISTEENLMAIDRDKLIGMSATHPVAMRAAMYKVISNSQDRPEVQVQAMAMALVATCDALDIDVKDILNTVEQLAADLNGPFTSTFIALKAYAREQIGSKL